jgi:integral membrane protein 2B
VFSTPQPDDVYYCGLKYIKDDVILNEPSADAPAARYQTIEENIKIFEEDAVEFISVPVPEFADSDPANIVHDFNKVSQFQDWEKSSGSLVGVLQF